MISARKKLNALRKIAATKFEERLHPRNPAGSSNGGRFTHSILGGRPGESTSTPAGGRAIPIIATPGVTKEGWEIELGHVVSGRKTTTLFELSAIGADDTGILTPDQVSRLEILRNGKWSHEKNLSLPPDDDLTTTSIYLGDRVQMWVNHVDGLGSVAFSVDDETDVDPRVEKTLPKPTKELIEMQMAFMDFLKSPASDQVLTNIPSHDTKERFQTRVQAYETAGFQASWKHPLLKTEPKYGVMYLDNRKSQKKFQKLGKQKNGIAYIRGKEILVKNYDGTIEQL